MCGRMKSALKREKIRNISLAFLAVPSWSRRRAVMRVSTLSILSSYRRMAASQASVPSLLMSNPSTTLTFSYAKLTSSIALMSAGFIKANSGLTRGEDSAVVAAPKLSPPSVFWPARWGSDGGRTLPITLQSCSCWRRNLRICSIRAWSFLWAGVTRQKLFMSSRFFLAISRMRPWNFSCSSSHVLKTSKHWFITFSNSSNGTCIKRRVLRTLSNWLLKSRDMASTNRRARWIGYLVLRIFLRWLKIAITAARIRSSSVADSKSLIGKSFISGL